MRSNKTEAKLGFLGHTGGPVRPAPSNCPCPLPQRGSHWAMPPRCPFNAGDVAPSWQHARGGLSCRDAPCPGPHPPLGATSQDLWMKYKGLAGSAQPSTALKASLIQTLPLPAPASSLLSFSNEHPTGSGRLPGNQTCNTSRG